MNNKAEMESKNIINWKISINTSEMTGLQLMPVFLCVHELKQHEKQTSANANLSGLSEERNVVP